MILENLFVNSKNNLPAVFDDEQYPNELKELHIET